MGDIAVRASLELSYRNLSEPAQAALKLLALSSSPTFAPWALAALAGIPLASAERLIDDLVDVHVVEAEAQLGKIPRYRLHDLVRAYARERGTADGSPSEHATILDYYDEAVIHFERALETVSLEDPEYHASSLAGLAYVYRLLGRYTEAECFFQRAASVAREHDNVNCLVYVTVGMGVIDLERGDRDAAEERFMTGLRMSRKAGYRPGESQALRCLGLALRAKPDYEASAEAFERAAAITDALGDRLGSTHARTWLADVRVREGRVGEGVRLLAGCLWYYRESGNRWGEAAVQYCLANAHLTAGTPARARSRARAAVAIWRHIDTPHWLAHGLDLLAATERACGGQAAAEQAAVSAASIRAKLA